MSHKIAGTNFWTKDLNTWLRFEMAVERRELALHKERCLPETARKIREQAAEDVLHSGLFYAAPPEEEAKHTEKAG